MSKAKKKSASGIVWFEIPADHLGRAKAFYGKLFGWKIAAIPGMKDYLHIDTGGDDASPDGAIMGRMCPEHPVTNYISVKSVTAHCAKVKKLGGQIHKIKTTVPGMGHFAICQDTEKNVFALWERDPKAK
ncbi:MAG TPA: VOC family protein [Candidatus Cybelea sp.]|jgi:predicted enzyme related to lactoylglutathione lyase|nr:VOC family protein [Candidatus Cybelea sp.]